MDFIIEFLHPKSGRSTRRLLLQSADVINSGTSKEATTDRDLDGNRQIVLYIPGIGTDVGNRRKRLLDKAIGRGSQATLPPIPGDIADEPWSGLDQILIKAYAFICYNFAEPDDEIILSGRLCYAMFSRSDP